MRSLRALVAVLGFFGCSACGESPSFEPPSVVLLTVDTLRADHLGAYGYERARTPTIDGLAQRGRLFRSAVTPLPRTTPALATLMTGLRPWSHGSREVGQKMRPVPSLASTLRDQGYATFGVSVNGAAGPAQNLDRGFDAFVGHTHFSDHSAAGVTRETLERLDELSPDAPLFLWVHYIDPHFPYAPPESWEAQPVAPECRELYRRIDGDLAATAHLRIDLDGRASRALEDCIALYDTEVAFTDFYLGRLLDGLEERGWLDDALLVFTSDHGENLGESGLFYEHGPSLSEASLRVPLIFAGRGVEPGVDGGLVRLEDLAPTILSLVGVPRVEWPPFEGVDLSSRVRGQRGASGTGRTAALAEAGRVLLPETFTYLVSGGAGSRVCVNGPRFSLCGVRGEEPRLYDHVADPELTVDVSERFPHARASLLAMRERWSPGAARERALRTDRYKLVERPLPEGGFSVALYDLAEDPEELHDRSGDRPELAARLQEQLHSGLAAARNAAAAGAQDAELAKEELEVLRALGYVN